MKRQTKRRHRKANKLRRAARTAKNKFVPPQTVEEFFAMPERYQDLWNNVGQAVTEVRTGASLRQGSRKFGLDPRTVLRLARPALRKLRNGRWAARTNDRLLRVLVIPTREGLREIGIDDFRQATLLGEYWNAVERYRDTGDASALREFRGKHVIDASGKRVPLLTDLHELVGLQTQNPRFEHEPAVGRISITSPAVMRPLEKLNEGKKYVDKIKPFNFLVTCHIKPFGHPPGVNPERFHLIAPYEADSRQWLKKTWIDQYSKNDYKITTTGHHGDRHTARVKTYGEVLCEYEIHPEAKCADADGKPCTKQTVGLLQRRHVRVEQIKYIGKESNSLEEVEAGLIHSPQNVYTEYPDPRRDEWQTKILPALRKIPLQLLVKISGMSRSTLIEVRAGRSRPHRKNQELLASIVRHVRDCKIEILRLCFEDESCKLRLR